MRQHRRYIFSSVCSGEVVTPAHRSPRASGCVFQRDVLPGRFIDGAAAVRFVMEELNVHSACKTTVAIG